MNQNTPARLGEGVVCKLPGYTDTHSTALLRLQHLASLGFPIHRAALIALIAPMAFGECRA